MTFYQIMASGQCPKTKGLAVRYNTNIYEDYKVVEGKLDEFREKCVQEGHILGNRHLEVTIIPLTVVTKKYRSIDAA
jgi:hypothetical protein